MWYQVTNPSVDSTIRDFESTRELFHLAERALEETGATGVAIALNEGAGFVCRATAGTTVPTLQVWVDPESGITGACIRSGRPEICDDASSDNRVNAVACADLGIVSIIAVPIIDGGQTVGVLEAMSQTHYAFGPAQRMALEALASEVQEVQFENFAGPVAMADQPSQEPADRPPSPAITIKLEDHAKLRSTSESQFIQQLFPADVSPGPSNGRLRWPVVFGPLLLCLLAVFMLCFHSPFGGAIVPGPFSSQVPQLPLRSVSLLNEPVVPALPTNKRDTQNGSSDGRLRGVDFTLEADPASEVKGLEAAARAGDPPSQLRLATALAEGAGVAKDLVAAYAWYVVANMSGEKDPNNLLPSLSRQLSPGQIAAVRTRLAEMFWKGIGVKPNRTAAYSWLVLAEAAGSQDAENSKRRLSSEMNDSQIAEAKRRAEVWLTIHRQSSTQR